MIFQLIDSLRKQISNYLLISILKKEEPYSEHYPQVPDVSPEAYRYSAYGDKAVTKADWTTALEMFTKALEIDSTIGEHGVYAAVTAMYLNLGMYNQAKEWCLRGYKKLDKMNLWGKLTMNYLHAQIFQAPNDAITYAEQLLEIDDQLPSGYWKLGDIYFYLFQWDKAIPEFEKVLEIYNKWDSKPYFVYHYAELGIAYHETGNFKKERKLYKKAQKDFPDDPEITDQYAILSLSEGDTIEANQWIRNYISKRKEQSWSEARLANYIGIIYSRGGSQDKAEEYYRRAISLESENPLWIHSLAYFLIDKDRNINEGLELEETLLKTAPENYSYLGAKGWGLYKQGKYKESLEILQKSWDLRMKNAIYNHTSYLHLEEAEKAISAGK
jgi:tetratricopeptide (TPR) repeat protein